VSFEADRTVRRKPFRALAALRRLKDGWERLAAGASPMQQYAWAEAFAATYWDYGEVVAVHTGPAEAPTALAALMRPYAGGPAEALGVRQLFEPMDFLHTGKDSLHALALALIESGDALYLPRVPADSLPVQVLQHACRGRALVRVAATDGYPVLALDEGWKEPESRFNAGRRSDFRRARRRAERFGKATFEFRLPVPHEVPALLEQAWLVEGAGWKGERGSALRSDPRRGAFFQRYASAAAARGQLRLAFMRIDGRPIAMQLAVESDERLWLLKIGYDERYAACSPGKQLMLYAAGAAARRGLRSVEFLGQPEPWTRLWTQGMRPCLALRAYPFTRQSVSQLAGTAIRYAVQRAERILGPAAAS
jgi:CelD/BcsL family acetyltransferase involved in cellulose biosynthesis